jgi:hypothetical protein
MTIRAERMHPLTLLLRSEFQRQRADLCEEPFTMRTPLRSLILAAIITLGAVVLPISFAEAIDPNGELTDTKLTPSVAKLLFQAATDLNARDYAEASQVLANASAVPGRSPYDDFQINLLVVLVAGGTHDVTGGVRASEAMAASPALADSDRKAVYINSFYFNVGLKDYWRAIQYGEIQKRDGYLDAENAVFFAETYAIAGSYGDAERVAQWALVNTSPNDKQRDKLQKIVGTMEVKQGNAVAMPNLGEELLGDVLQGISQGAGAPPSGSNPEEQKANARTDSANALSKGEQQAASELLSATSAYERPVYADIQAKEAALSRTDKARADRTFQTAYASWQKGDCGLALSGFESGLAIDPANAAANYYVADCLVRQPTTTLSVIDYLARAIAFGDTGSDAASMARDALKQLSQAQASAQN